jgi:exopolyphosphatase/guanosine-5'-triphosphate,3'-diphosphate pyrophosphatase
MTRVAAFDCGTNSLRLLIADVDSGQRILTDIVRDMTVVRLGQGVDKTGEFADEALERTFAATDAYAALCKEHGVEAIRFVATSATRDARNRDVFLEGVRSRLGVVPEVISGDEEARLSFIGATSVLDASHDAPFLVVDLGGGSTEVVLGTDGPVAAHSMDVGCVRMTERHLVSDPPEGDEIAAATVDIHAAIDEAFDGVPVERTRTLVGLAGSITTVTAHALGLHSYQREAINGAVLPIDAAIKACDELIHATHSSRAALGFMHPGRVDVIGAGALVWRTLMARVRTAVQDAGGELPHVVTSEHDILDGIAFSVAERSSLATGVTPP